MQCPYCNTNITTKPAEFTIYALSAHKATCSKKRFLGGELQIDTWDESQESLQSFILKK